MIGKVIRWAAPVAVVCAVSAFGLGTAEAGKQLATSPVKARAGAAPASNPLKGKLTSTRLSNGYSGASSPGSFYAVDAPQTFTCGATKAPCTIEAIMAVQFDSGAQVGAPGPWGLCLAVDGFFDTICPYAGDGASNGFFTASTQLSSVGGLAAGTHTAQTYLYTSNATKIYNYHIIYQQYI